MKLKTFVKVNIATNTRYIVYDVLDGVTFIEDFSINYLDEQDKLNEAILKRMKYEDAGATVQHVDIYKSQMEVTLIIKGVTK